MILRDERPINLVYNDPNISPVIRQSLLHWGYEVTLHDVEEQKKKKEEELARKKKKREESIKKKAERKN